MLNGDLVHRRLRKAAVGLALSVAVVLGTSPGVGGASVVSGEASSLPASVSGPASPGLLAVTYTATGCTSGYYADLDAQTYLSLSSVDYEVCPVRGMIQSARGYFPVWGFETNVANDYGKIMIKQDGGCTSSPDTGPYFDFQLPCKAHDYCYDLIRSGFGGTVGVDSCDYAFYLIMLAHCNNRTFQGACEATASTYFAAVSAGSAPPTTLGTMQFVANHSAQCADVGASSTADGAAIVQWPCSGTNNQRFRVVPAPGFPGFFRIQAAHSGKCVEVGADAQLRQYPCATNSQRRFRVVGSNYQDNYTIRSALHSNSWCWDVPGSSQGLIQLTEYGCYETLNQRWSLK